MQDPAGSELLQLPNPAITPPDLHPAWLNLPLSPPRLEDICPNEAEQQQQPMHDDEEIPAAQAQHFTASQQLQHQQQQQQGDRATMPLSSSSILSQGGILLPQTRGSGGGGSSTNLQGGGSSGAMMSGLPSELTQAQQYMQPHVQQQHQQQHQQQQQQPLQQQAGRTGPFPAGAIRSGGLPGAFQAVGYNNNPQAAQAAAVQQVNAQLSTGHLTSQQLTQMQQHRIARGQQGRKPRH